MNKPSRIIDTHQHVFWAGRDDAGLIADMNAHRVAYAWLLSWEILPAENNTAYSGGLNPEHKRADGTHAGIPLSDRITARDRYPKRFVLGDGQKTHTFLKTLKLSARVVENIYHRNAERLVAKP